MLCPPRNHSLLLTAAVSLSLLGVSPSARGCGDATVTIFPLPGLPGLSLQASALSSGGQITGFGSSAGFLTVEAFLFSAGSTINLGGLGGNFSQGLAVNASGHVAGAASIGPGFEQHAFLATNGAAVDLGTLGGSLSFAYAINNADVIAGQSTLTDDLETVAFVYTNGVMTSLGTLGGTFSSGYAINQNGDVAGDSNTAEDLETHAFLYTNGVMVDLGTLGGYYSTAYGLNDSGVVVGESALEDFETHGFVYANGVMVDVGTLGGTFSSATAVNNAGQAIGVSTTAGGTFTHGFVFSSGVLTDLGTLGGNYVEPFAINNLGQIVGRATLSNAVQHAFLWANGAIQDLNALLPPASGWELQLAQFINDAGRVVGVGLSNGVQQVFVMDLAAGGNNHLPVAVAGNDQSGQCPATISLDGSQSSDPDLDALAYEWSLNGNVVGTDASFNAVFAVGTHTLTLKVTDPCGLSALDDVTVTVTDTTAPTIVSSPASATASVVANCLAVVPDVTVEVVATDGCSASVVVSQSPAAGTSVGLGLHTITVTVTDGSGNASTPSVALSVVDNTSPVIASVSGPVTVATDANCLGAAPNLIATVVASDNCTAANQLIVSQSPAAGTLLAQGAHLITVTVTDASGNTSTATVALTVAELTAPIISSVSASPSTLSPPNGQMVSVSVSVSATDNCDSAPVNTITSVTCTEPAAAGDIVVTGPLSVNLAAKKASSGNARVYTITVTCTDASGNTTTGTVTVTVPKSNGNGGNKNKP